MPSPLPVDRVEYLRRRRTARAVTALAFVLVTLRVRRLVLSATSDDRLIRAAGAWFFFFAGLEVIALVAAVVWAWRRSYAARPAALPLDASQAVTTGVPELDGQPEGRHLGLSGSAELPRRW